MKSPIGRANAVLLAVIVALTLATGYIHFWVGGIMLTLNAAGYAALAGAVVISVILFRRLLPLVLIALAAYATATIVGWLVMGPYFDVAYLAKGIEIGLIVSIGFALRRLGGVRDALAWARTLVVGRASGRRRRSAGTAAAQAGEE